MSEDMSDIIQKMSEMLKNNEMPDNIKSLMGQFASEQNSSFSPQGNSGNTTESSDQRSSNDSFEMPNIDIGTMLKMKSIIDRKSVV